MKAHEVNVGEWFVGSMEYAAWDAAKDKRKVEGEEIHVSARCSGEEDAKIVLDAMRQLPHEHVCQIGRDSIWVCGVREKRSKFVRLRDWHSAMPGGTMLSHLLQLYKLLSKLGPSAQVDRMEYAETEVWLKEKWPDEYREFMDLYLPERRERR